MNRPTRWVTYASLVLAGLVAALGLVVVAYGAYLATFLALPKSDEHPPLRLYSAPFLLHSDLSLAHSRLPERLQRLGYRQVKTVQSPGDYQLTEEALTIYLHSQPESYVGATMVTLPLDQGRVVEVLSPLDGTPLFSIFLEPELLSGVRGESRQVREWIPLAQIPPQIVETVLTIEDRRFYSHFGIDPVAVGRAVWTNFTKGGVVQGGSTITQQLAKNLFYSPQRTMGRKFKEALAALVLEVKYTKQDILESYLNEIYLGQAGFVSIFGVREAAHRYFGKTLQELTVEEIAMIAGLIKGPNSYAPTKHPESAKQRRDVVLRRLRETGLLTEEVWKRAMNEPVRVTPSEDVLTDAPYFVDAVLRQVEECRRGSLAGRLADRQHAGFDGSAGGHRIVGEGTGQVRGCASPSQECHGAGARGGRGARSQDRVYSGAGGRAGLPAESIQSRRSGAAPTGLALQTLRLSCGVGSGS